MFYFIVNILRNFLIKDCRPVYCILYGRRRDTWVFTRFILSFLCGAFFAWFLWYLLMLNFNFSWRTQLIVLGVMALLMGVGFMFSRRVKSVTLLIFVAMIGKSGRNYLRALSFAFIITGPIENLATNGGEVVRVFTCSAKLTYNLTKTRLDLMAKPFKHTLAHMKDNIREVQRTFSEVKRVVKPIRDEVESVEKSEINHREVLYLRREQSEAERVQNRYKRKFTVRCKKQLEKSKERCRQIFATAYDNCQVKFPRIVRTLLCWPFRIDLICKINILGNPDKVCDARTALPVDFGENYVNLTGTARSLFQNASEVRVKYKVLNGTVPQAIKNADKTAELIKKEFKKKKQVFDYIMSIMSNFLSFLFIRVIVSSLIYQRNYNRKMDFDNVYITSYFKHVDERRKKDGKRSILPLKKFEKRNLIDLDRPFSETKEESREQMVQLLQFSLEVLTSSFFLLLDYVIVELLEIVRNRSVISYVQEGEHTIKFHIKGVGLMAKLLRTTLKGFNMHEHVSTYLTNETCLPRASKLPESFYIKLLILYAVIIFLIYKSTLFIRMRRVICAYFYRKREKKRVLYLYNRLLKQRHALFEVLLKHAQENAAVHQVHTKINVFLKARLKWPQYFDWLKHFNVARRSCLICSATEDEKFIICCNPNCRVPYCHECWEDIAMVCLVCDECIKNIYIPDFGGLFEIVPISEVSDAKKT